MKTSIKCRESDFEVLRRAAGRKSEDVPVKRRKLDACAYAQSRSDADASDVIVLDARLILDPRSSLTLPKRRSCSSTMRWMWKVWRDR